MGAERRDGERQEGREKLFFFQRYTFPLGSLEESFSDHPGFQLPLSNFSLDLNRTPLETDHFQDTLDKLRSHLYHHNNEALPTSSSLNKNADLVTQNSVPTQQGGRVDGVDAGNVLNGHSGRSAGGRGKGHTGSNISSSNNRHLNSENSLFESARRNHKNADKAKYHGNDSHSIMASFQYQNGTADAPIGEQVGCVRTTVDPHSFTTPEKLILEPGIRVHPAAVATSSWMDKFPRGARTVTIPRGDKGFGFIMVEKKVSIFKNYSPIIGSITVVMHANTITMIVLHRNYLIVVLPPYHTPNKVFPTHN